MARQFATPQFYRSSLITGIKKERLALDPRKKDLSPTLIERGALKFKIARHFGFCYGVENAIEIAYRALEENSDKRVFLLSEMIHNPAVNGDLIAKGVKFLLSPEGTQLIPFEELTPNDIVILPAFGVTVEIFDRLAALGVNPRRYNATCPFVEKVWRRAAQLGEQGFSIVIHGKHFHEETRATFSHAALTAPSIVIRNIEEARRLAGYILAETPSERFSEDFADRYSPGFNPEKDLVRLGVVNQTTMLAGETREIAEYLKSVLVLRYGEDAISDHYADTRDTLCYATTENQTSVSELIREGGDLALVVGGFNSSNTSHLAKLCSSKVETYHIRGREDLLSIEEIRHYNLDKKEAMISTGWYPRDRKEITILLTAGASTPDVLVEEVIDRVSSLAQP